MKVWIEEDELYPVYSADPAADATGVVEWDVEEETFARWQAAGEAWWAAQAEMGALVALAREAKRKQDEIDYWAARIR